MKCEACKSKLDLVFPEIKTNLQYDNALCIEFRGGYGMFVDRLENSMHGKPDHSAIICHSCAHKLCADNPWIANILDPEFSHTHRKEPQADFE